MRHIYSLILIQLFSLAVKGQIVTPPWEYDESDRLIKAYYDEGIIEIIKYDPNGLIAFDSIYNPCDFTPPPTITSNSGSFNMCSGDSIIITAASGGISYKWSTGDTTKSIKVKSGGSYSVTVQYSEHCFKTNTVTIKINSLPNPSINASAATTFCSVDSVTLTSSLTGSYLWNTGETTKSMLHTSVA